MIKNEMTLTQMRTYQGTGKKPNGFDAFWDARCRLLDQVNLEWVVNPCESEDQVRMKVYRLSFKSFDGARITAKMCLPISDGPVPCVLQFHGYPGASRPYFEHASFIDAGIAVIAMDCRGQGGLSTDVGGVVGTTVAGHLVTGIDDKLENMLYVKIYSDVVLLSKLVTQLEGIDPKRIMVNGASQGAALAIVCAALNPTITKGAFLYPFLSDFERVIAMDLDEVAYEGLRYYSRWFDPDGIRQEIWFERLGYIDVRHFATRIQCPVLFGISLDDSICPPSTQFAVYNAISTTKKLFRYPGKGHEPIHAFDDRIIPFLVNQTSAPKVQYGQMCLSQGRECPWIHISRGLPNVAIVIQGENIVGTHALRRYLTCGYDVLSISNISYSWTEQDLPTLLNQIALTRSHMTRGEIVIVAEGACVGLAIGLAASVGNMARLIVQSPDLSPTNRRSVYANAARFGGNVLMGIGGLESVRVQNDAEKLIGLFSGSSRYLRYPKYMAERINAFEDEKMRFLTSGYEFHKKSDERVYNLEWR